MIIAEDCLNITYKCGHIYGTNSTNPLACSQGARSLHLFEWHGLAQHSAEWVCKVLCRPARIFKAQLRTVHKFSNLNVLFC